MIGKDNYCHCCRGDVAEKGCKKSKCGPQYPWDRAKKDATAIFKSIKTLQRVEQSRGRPSKNPTPNCVSGTNYTNGRDILKAIRKQNKRRAIAIETIADMNNWLKKQQEKYDDLMAEKRQLTQV